MLRKYAELTGDDGSGSKRKAHFSQVVASFSGQGFHQVRNLGSWVSEQTIAPTV